MKRKLQNLLGSSGGNAGFFNTFFQHRFHDQVEVLSDQAALQVRGGDKDYSPAYDNQLDDKNRMTDPSLLLTL